MTREQSTASGCWEHLVIALKLTRSQWASKAARDAVDVHKFLKRTPIVGWQNNGLLELAEPIFAVRTAPRAGYRHTAILRPDGESKRTIIRRPSTVSTVIVYPMSISNGASTVCCTTTRTTFKPGQRRLKSAFPYSPEPSQSSDQVRAQHHHPYTL